SLSEPINPFSVPRWTQSCPELTRTALPHGKMTPRGERVFTFVASRRNDTEAYSGRGGKRAVPKWGSAAADRSVSLKLAVGSVAHGAPLGGARGRTARGPVEGGMGEEGSQPTACFRTRSRAYQKAFCQPPP